MTGPEGGFSRLDLVHNIHTFSDLTKYAIAPTIRRLGGVVKEMVVRNIDKELR